MKVVFSQDNITEDHKYNVVYGLACTQGPNATQTEGVIFVPSCVIHANSLEELRNKLYQDIDNFINRGLKPNE